MNRASLVFAATILVGCAGPDGQKPPTTSSDAATPVAYFKVDPSTSATLTGKVRFTGRRPQVKPVDMESEPECARLNKGARPSENTVVFVYVKSGLEGKKFEVPSTPVTIDQKRCTFGPRVLGVQTGQTLQVVNSDPVTHNIHPMPQINREWNQSQGPGDPPLIRKFARPELMVPVKCNIHRWMRAFIGVVDHPYFTVTKANGSYEIPNVPPGSYVVAAVHETAGSQEQPVALAPSGKSSSDFVFKGE